MSGRSKALTATCPDCRGQRTVYKSVGPTVIAAGIIRRCRACANRAIAQARTQALALRICPDCDDQRVMLARSLRVGGRCARRGDVVRRRCARCNGRFLAPRLPRGSRPAGRSDIDEVVVLRLISGRRDTPSNIAERLEATRQLTGHGLTARQVAERIGVHERTVTRYRRELAA